MSSEYDDFPPPPPWTREFVNGRYIYINDETKEETDLHPMQRVSDNMLFTVTDNDGFYNEGENQYPVFGEQAETPSSLKGNRFPEFRCDWKELGLFGDRQCFGLTIQLSVPEFLTMVKFDGVDASFEFTVLDGPYGPVGRHDLFIGSRVKLLGRTLTISYANPLACQWIDKEYNKLVNMQNFLRSKIENIGAIPIVKRAYWEPLQVVPRGSKGIGGRCDLRKLLNENKKLGEQLAALGLGDCIREATKMSNSKSNFILSTRSKK